MKAVFFAIFLLSNTALAGPPFNYFGARSHAEERTQTDIPLQEQIYVLGPAKHKETYTLNGAPAEREVSECRIVSSKVSTSIKKLWNTLQIHQDAEGLVLSVYRSSKPIEPVITIFGSKLTESAFSLLPGDVIRIRPPQKPGFVL